MHFKLHATDCDSKARAGTITLDHGTVETPIFMPVGTLATVKGVHQRELEQEIDPDIILGNTYHLYLRPQVHILEKAGGIHKFMNWNRDILTDSGGYQVYSLSANRKIKEEGVKFKSHIDGSYHTFTPENVMEIQRSIGADIIMAFDECTPYPCDYQYAKRSMHMTHRWLDRCVEHLKKTPLKYDYEQSLFPIVQGSTYKDLRKQSAEYIASVGAEGNAIGGLSVGEPAEEMYEMTSVVTEILPEEKPRYLMGVGTPINILENIASFVMSIFLSKASSSTSLWLTTYIDICSLVAISLIDSNIILRPSLSIPESRISSISKRLQFQFAIAFDNLMKDKRIAISILRFSPSLNE